MAIKNRAVKFRFEDQIVSNLSSIYIEKCNLISKILFPRIIANEFDFKKQVMYIEGNIIKELKDVLNFKSSAWERTIVRSVLERYRSYFKRNKKFPKHIIKFRNDKSIRIQSGILKDKETHFSCKLPSGERIPINATVLGTMGKYRSLISKDLGGNLDIKTKIFIARAKIEFDWLYEPKSFIGTDINMRQDVFLTCVSMNDNESLILPHNTEFSDLIYDIDQLNREISNSNKNNGITSSKRRRRRLRIQKLHNKMVQTAKPYINKVIDFAIQKQSVLCIDKANTGARNGSYGQDKIISGLIRECENQRIPFVVVPPAYSSKLCSNCLANVDRPVVELVKCSRCGMMDADINGAKNIANFGKIIFENDESYFKYTWLPNIRSSNESQELCVG